MKRTIWLLIPTAALIAAGTIRTHPAHARPEPALGKQTEVALLAQLGTVDIVGQQSGRYATNEPVLGYSYQLNSPRSGAKGNGTISFTKPIDETSPSVFNTCATNENLSQVTFYFAHTIGNSGQRRYYEVQLVNASIGSVTDATQKESLDASTNKVLWETVTLNFEKIIITALPSERTFEYSGLVD